MRVCVEHQRLALLTTASGATNGDARKYFRDDTGVCGGEGAGGWV